MRLLHSLFVLSLAALLQAGVASATGNRITYGSVESHECFVGANMAHLSAESALPSCNRALGFAHMDRRERAATFVNRGILYIHRRSYETAMADFDRALQLVPGFAEAHLNRGNALLFLGLHEQAIADYSAAIAGGTRKLHAAHYNRGLAREQMRQPELAYGDFQRAVELRPDWPLAVDRIESYAGMGYGR